MGCSPAYFSANSQNIPYCSELTPETFQPKLKWDWYSQLEKIPSNFPEFSQVMAAPVVGDVNGDGLPEIAFVNFASSSYHSIGVLRLISGSDGRNIFSRGDADTAPKGDTTPLLIDIDGDARSEIFYLHYSERFLIALNYDGSLRWRFPLANQIAWCIAGFSATDLDFDGKAEILVANQVISENSSHLPFEKVSLQNHTNPNHCHSIAASLDPAKPNEMQIVDPTGAYDKNGQKLFSGAYTWMSVADVLPSPGLEIISTGSGRLSIYSGVNGATLKDIDLSVYNDLKCGSGIGGGPSTIGNFDEDKNTIEIAVATGRHLTIFNTEGVPIAISETQDCSSLATGITSFDFNGDGKPEILYGDEEYFRVYELKNRRLNVVFKSVNPSGTLLEYPLVADIDGDPHHTAEIVVVSNNYAVGGFYQDADEVADRDTAFGITGVRAFEAGAGQWMPTRSLWNQYHYSVAGVTDRLRPVSNTSLSNFTSRIFRRNADSGTFEKVCRVR